MRHARCPNTPEPHGEHANALKTWGPSATADGRVCAIAVTATVHLACSTILTVLSQVTGTPSSSSTRGATRWASTPGGWSFRRACVRCASQARHMLQEATMHACRCALSPRPHRTVLALRYARGHKLPALWWVWHLGHLTTASIEPLERSHAHTPGAWAGGWVTTHTHSSPPSSRARLPHRALRRPSPSSSSTTT